MSDMETWNLDDDLEVGIPAEELLDSNAPTAFTSGKALAQAPTPSKNKPTDLLEEIRTLARVKGKKPTVMDGVMAGLSAQLGKPSRNKAVAFLDALFTSANAGYQARKEKPDDKQFDRLTKLYDIERRAKTDEETSADRRRRTNAYEASVYGGRGGRAARPTDPLIREKRVLDIMKENRWQKALDADDAILPGQRGKLSPEQRKELESKRDADEQRLRSLGLPQGSNGVTSQAPGTPQPQRPTTTPGPTPPPVPQAAPPKPKAGLPKGVDRDTAIAQTQAALEAAKGDPAKQAQILDRARNQFGLQF